MDDESVVLRARALLEVGRPEEARSLLAQDPGLTTDPDAMVVMADALSALDRYGEALTAASAAIDNAPDWFEVHIGVRPKSDATTWWRRCDRIRPARGSRTS